MAGAMGSHHSQNSGSDEWLTPPEIIQSLGPFDLDPCSPVNRPWPTANKHYTIEDDGLASPWDGYVWCNPPYGKAVWTWLSKLAEHNDGVALVFARTETAGFVSEVWEKATAVLFLHGRLHFHYVDGTRAPANSGAPSALVAYGDRASDKLFHCGIKGTFISNWSNI